MASSRIGDYETRIRAELQRAFDEEHTPRETARSFAVGTFITMLPTFGVGLVAFLVLVSVFDSISKIALFASLLVFNPVVKWGVYASSFALGVFLLGPVEGATVADASLQAGPAIVTRLVVGNLILAVIATALGYVAIHRLATRYDATELGDALETFVDDTLEASSDR